VRLAVIASKMADHWVAEVFPPKFQFGSVDELLSGPGEDEKSKEKVKYLDEVYRKVYFEQEKDKSQPMTSCMLVWKGLREVRRRNLQQKIENDQASKNKRIKTSVYGTKVN